MARLALRDVAALVEGRRSLFPSSKPTMDLILHCGLDAWTAGLVTVDEDSGYASGMRIADGVCGQLRLMPRAS